ncbi:MAG TPA: U32 family peptidase [Sediminispirochaeta sp.]|nr:U32 family peptidase [Sediminispirochaeta sp.]
MELLAPAGNLEKLKYAYLYGADAAYIGISSFSLRSRAENFSGDQWREIARIKGRKKLYGAINIFFHNDDLRQLEENREYLSLYPLDAIIVSDLGAYTLLRRLFPEQRFHLSTQANCINREAARLYYDLGFSRVILGRETSLSEIREIKDTVPELELEAFVHGAMCLAYSGRCFLSSYMAGRSANQGDCTHSCRWNYRVLEEKQRPGEYYPVLENPEEGYTTILSSKDLCMFDHIEELRRAGLDSVKIEGRMKSLYYTAVVTRSYRKALDTLGERDNADGAELDAYRQELYKVSRREFSTGFYFGLRDADQTTSLSYHRRYQFLGTLGPMLANGRYQLDVKNQIRSGQEIEYIGPDILFRKDRHFKLYDEEGRAVEKADHGRSYSIETSVPVEEGYILRQKTERSTEPA